VPFLVRYPNLFQKRDDTLLSADTIPKFESMVTADVRPARLLNDVDSFRDASRLYICVDLNCDRTVESLCALIEEEVRRAFRERQGSDRAEIFSIGALDRRPMIDVPNRDRSISTPFATGCVCLQSRKELTNAETTL
jgi:hypothetical protein